MLNFSAALWPLFWTIIGSGAVLTVALCWLAAVIRPRRRHAQQSRQHRTLPFGRAGTSPLRRAALRLGQEIVAATLARLHAGIAGLIPGG